MDNLVKLQVVLFLPLVVFLLGKAKQELQRTWNAIVRTSLVLSSISKIHSPGSVLIIYMCSKGFFMPLLRVSKDRSSSFI